MHEVLTEATQWVNLPFTVLLGLVVLYWLLVGVGVRLHHRGHVHVGHLHGGHHVAPVVHAHVPMGHGHAVHHGGHGIHKEVHGGHHPSFFVQLLTFLNVGQLPLMFVMSILALCLWLGSMIANHYLTGGSATLSAAYILPNFLVSFVATRFLTYPFRPLFRAISREHVEEKSALGQCCTITTSEATPQFGQAQIQTDGAPLLLNVRTVNDARLARGEQAVVVRIDDERSLYFIAPLLKPNPEN
jgi:hypothetical protein